MVPMRLARPVVARYTYLHYVLDSQRVALMCGALQVLLQSHVLQSSNEIGSKGTGSRAESTQNPLQWNGGETTTDYM